VCFGVDKEDLEFTRIGKLPSRPTNQYWLLKYQFSLEPPVIEQKDQWDQQINQSRQPGDGSE
jgi:hypothetical protein